MRNRDYGTKVVGGESPKKAGENVEGIPVFASVADAVTEEGEHLGRYTRKAFEHRLDLRRHLVVLHLGEMLEFDMELAAMRPPGILAQFGAADLLSHRVDVGVLEQFLGNARPNPEHLGERSARHGKDLEDEMALLEIGQEVALAAGQQE